MGRLLDKLCEHTEFDPWKNESPTGVSFVNYLHRETKKELHKMLKHMCLQSECEPFWQYDGLSVARDESNKRSHGGVTIKALAKLDEWWRKRKTINDPLSRDYLFNSCVIHPEFKEAVAHFYHRQNFCVVNQLLHQARSPVVASLEAIVAKTPELQFDWAAAMVPFEAVGVIFGIGKDRSVADCLRHPLSMLGLTEHPWHFSAEHDLPAFIEENWHSHPDWWTYTHTAPESKELEARWRQKKKERKRLQKEKPAIFKKEVCSDTKELVATMRQRKKEQKRLQKEKPEIFKKQARPPGPPHSYLKQC